VEIKKGKFDVGEETLAYTEFVPAKTRCRVLSLHGAGKATRQRIFYLAEKLAENDIGFFCFDFSGHGESTGIMSQSSLSKRCAEAKAAFDFMGSPAPTILMGNSMGGYIAVEMLETIQPEYLILICPALYAAKAFDVPFDQNFSDIIRSPNSFEENNILPRLSNFTGQVLLLIGDQDDVIPARVMDIYQSAFESAKSIKLMGLAQIRI
jgi:pimeloyl-ACP methyl ester carboxylesterase